MSAASRLNVIRALRGEHGQPLVVLPWWAEAIERLDDATTRELVLSLTRQSGKSQLLAALAISELFTRPNAFVFMIASSKEQATTIFTRKLARPLTVLLRDLGISKKTVVVKTSGIEIPATGAMLEVVATTDVTTPGRSPSLLIIDEARYVPDNVFAVLAPSVIGANGKLVVASSAGPPSGFFYQLVQNQTSETWVYRSSVNDNPAADGRVINFLKRRLALLVPSAARRELGNDFVDDGESFLPGPLIDAAVDDTLGEWPSSALQAFAFLDLSRKHDLTSCVVVVRAPARRPEAEDHLVAVSLRLWDPRQSPTKETPFEEVRAHLAALPGRFPGLTKIRVDEGAEAGAVLPFARSHPDLAGRVEGFQATADSNAQMWSALAARLHAQTLSIPRHERLLGELHGLRQESFAFGAKWRIVDSSKRFHRDVSLALAGAVFAAGETVSYGPVEKWIHTANAEAPPLIAAQQEMFYGAGSSLDAFGGSSTSIADMARKAFGS